MARSHDHDGLHVEPGQQFVGDGSSLPGELVTGVRTNQGLQPGDGVFRRVGQQAVDGLGERRRVAGIEQAGYGGRADALVVNGEAGAIGRLAIGYSPRPRPATRARHQQRQEYNPERENTGAPLTVAGNLPLRVSNPPGLPGLGGSIAAGPAELAGATGGL